MSKNQNVEFSIEDAKLLKGYLLKNAKKPLDTVNVVRIKKDLELDFKNSISLLTYKNSYDISLVIGNQTINLRNYKELKNLIGSLALLIDNTMAHDELISIAENADKNHDHYDLTNLNIKNMEFTNQITDNKGIQEDITGETIQERILQKASVPEINEEFKQDIQDRVREFYDLRSSIMTKQSEIDQSNLIPSSDLVEFGEYSDKVGELVQSIIMCDTTKGVNIIDAIIENDFYKLNTKDLHQFDMKLKNVTSYMEKVYDGLTFLSSGISKKKFSKYSVNFNAMDIIEYTRDPNKGIAYAQEQLSRLSEDDRAKMLTEIENILNQNGN